jgi:phosphoglycerate dehydrogenase-like enzyme
MASRGPVLIVEDDVWARLIGVVLDSTTSEERLAAFADFMSPDVPDFRGWCDAVRSKAKSIYPSDVRLVSSGADLRHNLASAQGIVTESMEIGAEEIALAPQLKVVHKYGSLFRNIDVAACEVRGIKVLGVRRRANVACAEHAFALLLTLTRKMHELGGLISVSQLTATGRAYRPFDRRHTPGANWGRFSGMLTVSGGTAGIIGLGEIGRELAIRAAAFGMSVLYFQRGRLTEAEERDLKVTYRPLEALLGESDVIFPQLPLNQSTLNLINKDRLALVKPGALMVNVSRAEVVDRDAVLWALRSGRLGGFALDSLYEEPGRADDELLSYENVILTPHMAGSPRTNGLRDIEQMVVGLAHSLAANVQ